MSSCRRGPAAIQSTLPPFSPALPSFLIDIMVLAYWDYSDEVVDLCMDLNKNSRARKPSGGGADEKDETKDGDGGGKGKENK